MKIERPISKQPLPKNATCVFKGGLFAVYQWEAQMFDGTTKIFEKIKRDDTALIIPVTPEGKIILVREEQPGKKPFITTVGGRIEEGEEPLAAAARELMEETGYSSSEWSLLSAKQPYSKMEWAVYTFIAKGATKTGEQNLDAGEKIETMEVSFEEFVEVVFKPEFDDIALKQQLIEARLDSQKMEKLRALFQ